MYQADETMRPLGKKASVVSTSHAILTMCATLVPTPGGDGLEGDIEATQAHRPQPAGASSGITAGVQELQVVDALRESPPPHATMHTMDEASTKILYCCFMDGWPHVY